MKIDVDLSLLCEVRYYFFMRWISFLVFGLLVSACAQKQVKVEKDDRLVKLSRMTKAREKKEEKEQWRNVIQSARSEKQNQIYKNYPLPPKTTEENLYTLVLQSYQAKDLNGVEFYSKAFLESYPKSVFSDNTLYLNGYLKLSLGLPGDALRDFERLLRDYPTGNKRAAALVGKGIAYKKLDLKEYAQRVFKEVRENYPGSPEFYRVELEEKLLSVD